MTVHFPFQCLYFSLPYGLARNCSLILNCVLSCCWTSQECFQCLTVKHDIHRSFFVETLNEMKEICFLFYFLIWKFKKKKPLSFLQKHFKCFKFHNFFPLNHMRVSCLLSASLPNIKCVFPTNKDFLLCNHNAVIKIRESALMHYYHVIFRPCSGPAICPNNVLYSKRSNSESHSVFNCHVSSFLQTAVLPQFFLTFDDLDTF